MPPFAIETRLTQIAMTVKPEGLIADEVCPRVMVPAEKFTYARGRPGETHKIPETLIGRRSRANQVEFGTDHVTESTEDHGLEDSVPVKDVHVARSGSTSWDPLAEATMNTSTLVALAREKRVADLVFAAGNYETAHQATLSGTSQWSHSNSDPIKSIAEAMDKPLLRPNALVLGQSSWTALRRHPKIVEATARSGAGTGAAGLAMRDAVAELFELDRIIIGRSFHNSAAKGQNASHTRLWGKHASLVHLNPAVSGAMSAQPTYCFTAEWMGRQVMTYHDDSIGVAGAEIVKVTECVKELVAWKAAGYHFKNAVA